MIAINNLLFLFFMILCLGTVSAQTPLPKAKPKAKEPVPVEVTRTKPKSSQPVIKLESAPQDTSVRQFFMEDDKVQISPEVQPEFPGGQKGLNMFIQEHLIYPVEAKANNAEGIVIVQFIIEADGRPLDPVIISDNVQFGAKEEVFRLISLMPRWKPAKMEGNPVPVFYTMPVSFNLK